MKNPWLISSYVAHESVCWDTSKRCVPVCPLFSVDRKRPRQNTLYNMCELLAANSAKTWARRVMMNSSCKLAGEDFKSQKSSLTRLERCYYLQQYWPAPLLVWYEIGKCSTSKMIMIILHFQLHIKQVLLKHIILGYGACLDQMEHVNLINTCFSYSQGKQD